MNQISEYRETELTEDVALSIAKLACRSFEGKTIERRVELMLGAAGSEDPELTSGRRFVIWDGDTAIAHARTFVRTVIADQLEIPVLALATVCSDPNLRGRGWGAKVTRRAFEQIGQPGWPDVCLFQTPVPEFYEKLNCRLITNRFVNRLNTADPEANPWRDDIVMIYPAEYAWPDGIIDLNGPDY